MNKGLERCPACGKIVKINRRQPHPETKECGVRIVNDRYAARGWRRVGFARSEIIKDALGPMCVEIAPGSVRLDDDLKEQVFDGYYVPGLAADAIEALGHVRLKPTVRREAVRILSGDPALVTAIDSVRRLNGSLPRFIKEIIKEHGNAEPYDIPGEPLEQLVHKGIAHPTRFEEDHDDDTPT